MPSGSGVMGYSRFDESGHSAFLFWTFGWLLSKILALHQQQQHENIFDGKYWTIQKQRLFRGEKMWTKSVKSITENLGGAMNADIRRRNKNCAPVRFPFNSFEKKLEVRALSNNTWLPPGGGVTKVSSERFCFLKLWINVFGSKSQIEP